MPVIEHAYQSVLLLDARSTGGAGVEVVDPPPRGSTSGPVYGCGACHRVLFVGLAARDTVRGEHNRAVRCPGCGATNTTRVTAVDRVADPAVAARTRHPERTPIRDLELLPLPQNF